MPTLCGWRREFVLATPSDLERLEQVPNWLCEVISPSTVAFVRARKLFSYARRQIRHIWIIDPEIQTLEVLRLDGETYRLVLVASGDSLVRAEPFDAIDLELRNLWAR